MNPTATVVALPMSHSPTTTTHPARSVARLGWLPLFLLFPAFAAAADKPSGLIVQVPPSISTESTGRLRSLLHGPLKRFEQESAGQKEKAPFVLICDFNPEGRASACEDFGACFDLATYL